jgi:immune inhibitor A
VDSRPAALIDGDGFYWDTFIQVHDATFGLSPTQALSLKTP